MRFCESHFVSECKRENAGGSAELADGIDHDFAGYGYYIRFHPECCPREYDGTTCEDEHPDG